MAICAQIDPATNAVIATTTPVGQCTAYILQDATDYLSGSVFQLPDSPTLNGFWMAGFVLPMALYLVAWAVGSISNFFNKES